MIKAQSNGLNEGLGARAGRAAGGPTLDASRRAVLTPGAIVAAGLALLPANGFAAEAANKVAAKYDVSFAGVDIGSFEFDSEVAGRNYRIHSMTQIKLLMGAFNWTARSVSEGRVARSVEPAAFDFSYNSNRKHYRSEVRFAKGSVEALNNKPPVRPSKKRVPLKPAELKGVMDPMSAIMAMTRGANRNPCSQNLDVFDGRMHFRLKLEPKGQREIAERGNSGQPRVGYVCRVRYMPIAGHKPSDGIKRMATSDGIEVVLRPVPAADLFVPYQITVPTGYGTVSIVSRNVEIEGEQQQRIALRY
jgi:hypothetical protein